MGAEEHTPERWTVTVDDSPVAGPVAYIDGLTVHPGGAFELADARLIASAPDLLAALEWAAQEIESEGLTAGIARAAIAKATGTETGDG